MKLANIHISDEWESCLFKNACDLLQSNNRIINNDKLMYLRSALNHKHPQDTLSMYIQQEIFMDMDLVLHLDSRTIVYPSAFTSKGKLGEAIIEFFEYESMEFLFHHKYFRTEGITIDLIAYVDGMACDIMHNTNPSKS